jgi:hypothetical protein
MNACLCDRRDVGDLGEITALGRRFVHRVGQSAPAPPELLKNQEAHAPGRNDPVLPPRRQPNATHLVFGHYEERRLDPEASTRCADVYAPQSPPAAAAAATISCAAAKSSSAVPTDLNTVI